MATNSTSGSSAAPKPHAAAKAPVARPAVTALPHGKNVLVGFIPAKFGETRITIDADHPLAPQVIAELPDTE